MGPGRGFIVLILALGAVVAGPIQAGVAQTPSAIPDDATLTGIQAGILRIYDPADAVAADGAVLDASPMAAPAATPLVRTLSVTVREYDTAGHAAAAVVPLTAGIEAQLSTAYPDDGTLEVTTNAIPNLGAQAMLTRVAYRTERWAIWSEAITVQRDTYVFVVYLEARVAPSGARTGVADPTLPTREIAAAVAGGAHSPDDVRFAEDGSSIGGLWGFMPEAGDPLLMGLVPVQDAVIFPVPASGVVLPQGA